MTRPDPDELLARVRAAEEQAVRGKLTIFFGAAPGVGKTFTMLEAARVELDQKRDVVIGIVETHKRYDTEAPRSPGSSACRERRSSIKASSSPSSISTPRFAADRRW